MSEVKKLIAARVFFTPEDVSTILQTPVSTVRHWVASGQLRSIKAGRLRRIPRRALADFLGVPLEELAA